MEINSFKICGLDRTPLCDLADNTSFRVRNVEVTDSVNEITTLAFDLPVRSPKFKHISCENLVHFDKEYYFIKTPQFNRDEDGKLYVHVECRHLSDILASQLISIEEITPLDVVSLMKIALQYDEDGRPTLGWKVGKVTVNRVAVRGLEANEASPFSILLTIAERYSGVLVFNSETMTVDMYPTEDQEHPKLDLQISKNLKEIHVQYDTSELITRLYGYGSADDKTGVELDFMSVSPDGLPYVENYNYFVSKGYSLDYIKANPALFVRTSIFRDDNIIEAQDLYDTTVDELAKASKPKINVEIIALDMSMAKGMIKNNTMNLSNNPYSLKKGDCVRIVDEDINADFLCNVTSRTIDYENPHLLTVELTNSIEYRDVLSELYANVSNMSTVVTSGGKINGGKIENLPEGSIGDILANYITAEQIEAKYATIETLRTEYLTAEVIRTTYLDAQSIAAEYATIGSLKAVEAQIEKLNVDEILGKLAEFEKLFAEYAEIKELFATKAEIEELKAGNVTVAGLLKAANAEIENLKTNKLETGEFEAYKATIEKLFAAYATIEYLEANYIKAQKIEATYAKITELDAVKGSFETLKADLAEVEKLIADKANIKDLEVINATIETLQANFAKIEKLVADKIDAKYLEAELAKIKTLIAENIEAVNVTIKNLDAKYATIENLNATNAKVEKLEADNVIIKGDLTANKADIGELNAQVANIETIMSGSVGTGILEALHITAKNVVIDDAVIQSAMIASLDVSKLNAGTISTNKFVIKSDDGGIQIKGATQQWTDKSGKVRMQAGRDAQGNFTFAIFGADGTTLLLDQTGIHKDAIPDKIIVNDMIADNAGILGSKLERESLIDKINEDGTKTIKSSKVWLDETNQSLGASFTQINTKVNETVKNYTPYFAKSTSNTTAPTTGWQTTQPTKGDNEYIWRKDLVTKTDGTTSYTTPYVVTGDKGKDGKDGKDGASGVSLAKVEVFYYVSTSNTTQTGGSWSVNTPTWVDGKYIWSKQKTTLSNGTTFETSPVCITGGKGSSGSAGQGVASIETEFYLSTSKTTQIGGQWQTTTPTWSSGKYVWTRSKITYKNPTSIAYTTPQCDSSWEAANEVDKKVQTLQTDFKVEQGRIETLIKDTTIDGKKLKDKYLETVATVDGMKTTISDVQTDVEGMNSKITEIKATADGVSSIVTANKGKWDKASTDAANAMTSANQTAEKFLWLVKSGTSSTNFELTDRVATLVANNINLKGLVTFSGLNSDTQNKINTAVDDSSFSKDTIDAWGSDLPPSTEDDDVPDTTIINGAYIRTKSIKTSQLDVDEILAENGVFMGVIKAMEINADMITSGTINANLLNVYGLKVLDKTSNIETFSVDSDGQVSLRGSVESYDYISGKSGWSINRKDGAEFNDVTLRGSLITGDGGIVSSGGSGVNLQINSSFSDGLNHWTQNTGYSVDASVQNSGVNSAKFARTGLTSDSVSYLYSGSGKIKAKEGDVFTAQAKFYTTNASAIDGSGVTLGIWFYNAGGSSLARDTVKVEFANNSWVYTKITSTAPANTASVALVVASNRNGTFWTSQPKLEEGSVATAWSLAPEDKVQQVRIWAGTSYENREYAPFIVYNDGSLKATKGIFGGVFTGDIQIGNISIIDPNSSNGNDALVTIVNGNTGVKAVQLTDTNTSSFAQNIVITDNFYNEKIKLNQNGFANIGEQLIVGDFSNPEELYKNPDFSIMESITDNGVAYPRPKYTAAGQRPSYESLKYGDFGVCYEFKYHAERFVLSGLDGLASNDDYVMEIEYEHVNPANKAFKITYQVRGQYQSGGVTEKTGEIVCPTTGNVRKTELIEFSTTNLNSNYSRDITFVLTSNSSTDTTAMKAAGNKAYIRNVHVYRASDYRKIQTVLNSTSLKFNGGSITNVGASLVVDRATNFDIGTSSNTTDLTVYGDANIKNSLKVFKEINYNDVVKCIVSVNGLDFNFYEGAGQRSYTVKWNTQGGTAIPDSYCVEGQPVAKPTNPTYSDGANFLGWFKDSAGANEWNFTHPVNSDMTLYAKWEEPTEPVLASTTNKDHLSVRYITDDKPDVVGKAWVLNFTSSIKGSVRYRWYVDKYIYYNIDTSYIEESDIFNNIYIETIYGFELAEKLEFDKYYLLKGRCDVTVKLGNTTKTFSYDGFAATCAWW